MDPPVKSWSNLAHPFGPRPIFKRRPVSSPQITVSPVYGPPIMPLPCTMVIHGEKVRFDQHGALDLRKRPKTCDRGTQIVAKRIRCTDFRGDTSVLVGEPSPPRRFAPQTPPSRCNLDLLLDAAMSLPMTSPSSPEASFSRSDSSFEMEKISQSPPPRAAFTLTPVSDKQPTKPPPVKNRKRLVETGGQSSAQSTVRKKKDPAGETVRPQEDGRFKVLTLSCLIENCKMILSSEDALARHLRLYHDGAGLFRCAVSGCGCDFESRECLDSHVAIHIALMPAFPCTQCGDTFPTYAELATHRQNRHEIGLFECGFSSCDQMSTTRAAILEHINTCHKAKQQLICQYCGKLFVGGAFKLKLHERTHSNIRPYTCVFPDCPGYSGTQKIHAIQHVKIVHFGLPASSKVQRELGIVDNRDPMQFIDINAQLL